MTTEVSKTPTERLGGMVREGPGQRLVPDMNFLRMCFEYMKYLEGVVVEHQGDPRADIFYRGYRELMKEKRLEAEELKTRAILERLRRGAR